MKKAALIAAFCSLSLAACLGSQGGPPAKAPKITEGRATMAKIGGRPLPVFEFSARIDDEDNKITGARVYVSISGDLYKKGGESFELVEPKTLAGEYVANVGQVRATVDPAKEEALATYLNGDDAKAAFQVEIDWKTPEGTETTKSRSIVFATDHATIASAGLAKEIK